MRKRAKILVGAAVGAGVLGLAAPAAALVSSYGDAGYSQDINGRESVVACDTAQDGNGVYANWWQTGQTNYDTVTNNRGLNTCNGAAAGSGLVRAHIIYINLNNRPDPHGPYVSY